MPHRPLIGHLLLPALLLLGVLPLVQCGGGGSGPGAGPAVPANCGCQVPGAVGAPGSAPGTTMTAGEVALAEEVLAQVNAERVARALPPLAWHATAGQVAYDHSIYQEGIGTITHDGPAPCAAPTDCLLQRLTDGGVAGFSMWGENVASGQPTAQSVMCGAVSWMLSAGHCANILQPEFTHIGIGVRTGAGTGPYWTQVFLRVP